MYKSITKCLYINISLLYKMGSAQFEITDKIKDLGTYIAKGKEISAELKLQGIKLTPLNTKWYQAYIKFYTDIVYQTDREGFSIKVYFSSSTLEDIFSRLKRANEGIEILLTKEIDFVTKYDEWKNRMDVMKCIFSLEEQTKGL